jgi:branched-chain amino acid transport system substrate-binding protein
MLSTTALAAPALLGSARAASAAPIRFGWLGALTGANSAPGIGFNRGIQFAADQINAAGGVNGRKIVVITRDTQGDPTKAVNAAVEMASRAEVDAIFGPTNSGEALATTPILARDHIPNLHPDVIDRLIDPTKYPNAFRLAPASSQWEDAARNYCLSVLKLKKIAIFGDTSGYGTTAADAAVADVRAHGGQVVDHALIDANQPDVSAEVLRAKAAGAEALLIWTDSTGLIARLINARARAGWDVPYVGHPSLGAGGVRKLLDNPKDWAKVYLVGYKSCSYQADGTLPPRTAAFVKELSGKVALNDTALWWVACGYDAVKLVAAAVQQTGSSDSAKIIGYWNGLHAYPGIFGDYSFSPRQHNGYPTAEVVMSKADSFRDGAYALAPGYG